MEKTGRKVEFFTWGFQPKRGQHIGGIGEREARDSYFEGEELLKTISYNDVLLA